MTEVLSCVNLKKKVDFYCNGIVLGQATYDVISKTSTIRYTLNSNTLVEGYNIIKFAALFSKSFLDYDQGTMYRTTPEVYIFAPKVFLVTANVNNPHVQGTIAMLGVFVDTFVILTLNALVIISVFYTSGGALEHGYTASSMNILNRTNLVQTAFGQVFGQTLGSTFVAICLLFFAFSSILGWNLFGKINALYLAKKNKKLVGIIYTIISIAFIMLGSLVSSDFVWELTDMFNNLMVIPNVIALFALSAIVVSVLKNKDKIH